MIGKLTDEQRQRADQVYALAETVLQIEVARAKSRLVAGDDPMDITVDLSIEFEKGMNFTLMSGLVGMTAVKRAQAELEQWTKTSSS